MNGDTNDTNGIYGNGTLPPGIRSRMIGNKNNINGLSMHVLEAGFESGARSCVLLLHGFPELAYSWRKIMLPLASAGLDDWLTTAGVATLLVATVLSLVSGLGYIRAALPLLLGRELGDPT